MSNNKPIALPIAINELQTAITEAVNNSHIPACIKDPIIANIYNQVHMQAMAEYEACKVREEGSEDGSNNNDADSEEPDNAR